MNINTVYDAVIWLAAQMEENPSFIEANREMIEDIIACVNDVPERLIRK